MKTSTRAAIAILALATTATPMLAQAQDRGYDRRDRGERHERYDRRDHDRGPSRDWRSDRGPSPRYVGPRHDDRRYDDRRYDDRRHSGPVRWDRNNRNWWRDHQDFRDYRGSRAGYWYAPGYGYYRVDNRYRDYRWRTGAYLPPAYRSYYVRDPNFYGLRPAPRGYRYVHAGNDIVMIALATGLITSVLNGVY